MNFLKTISLSICCLYAVVANAQASESSKDPYDSSKSHEVILLASLPLRSGDFDHLCETPEIIQQLKFALKPGLNFRLAAGVSIVDKTNNPSCPCCGTFDSLEEVTSHLVLGLSTGIEQQFQIGPRLRGLVGIEFILFDATQTVIVGNEKSLRLGIPLGLSYELNYDIFIHTQYSYIQNRSRIGNTSGLNRDRVLFGFGYRF